MRTVPVVLSACFLSVVAFAQSSWTQLSPSGTPPIARTGAPAVYDSAGDRMIVFGGRDGSGNNRNDVWVLTHANGEGGSGQWIRLIANGAAGSPPARSGHSAVYDSANNRMIIFGGCAGYCAPVLNDVWVLSNANGVGGVPAWTQLSPGAGPAGRTNAAVAFGMTPNSLVVFGGQDGSANPCSTFSDIWTLSNVNGLGGPPAWTPVSLTPGSTIPPGQNGATVVYENGDIRLFGGTGLVNGKCQATNAVWSLVVMMSGTEVLPINRVPEGAVGSPAARTFASGVYDAKGGRMLVFGGVDGSGNYLNDVWSLGGLAWSQLSPTGGPPAARRGQAAIFDSTSRRMTIFGGSNASGVLNDSWTLTAPGVAPMWCGATANPDFIRTEGITEHVGDVVLYCGDGTPTPQGEAIPEYTLTLTLNTDVTSRLLPEAKGLSEALLIVDDAFPAVPVPSSGFREPYAPLQIFCAPLGSACSEIGTGGTPSPYQTQSNVFVGKQSNATTLYWKIPIDPPGVNNTRFIRLANLRANASQLGPFTGSSATVTATVQIQGAHSVPVAYPQPVVALTEPGAAISVAPSSPIPQCEPHNAVLLGGSGTAAFDFSVQTVEGFADTFKYRNYGTTLFGPEFPPVLAEQNVPGFFYSTETGTYSPSLFITAPTLGLADFGTRILVSLGPISAGTHLFVPTTINMTGNYSGDTPGQLQLVQANEYGNSAPGYEPVASIATIGTTPVGQASRSGSTAYAVYEVIYSDPNTIETASIPVAVAFTNTPAIGTVNATTSLAPLSTVGTASQSASIPRFANVASPQPAYSITACAGVQK
jgi:hypothetical protein